MKTQQLLSLLNEYKKYFELPAFNIFFFILVGLSLEITSLLPFYKNIFIKTQLDDISSMIFSVTPLIYLMIFFIISYLMLSIFIKPELTKKTLDKITDGIDSITSQIIGTCVGLAIVPALLVYLGEREYKSEFKLMLVTVVSFYFMSTIIKFFADTINEYQKLPKKHAVVILVFVTCFLAYQIKTHEYKIDIKTSVNEATYKKLSELADSKHIKTEALLQELINTEINRKPLIK